MTNKLPHRLRNITVSVACVLVGALIATPSHAQWLTQDNASIAKNVAEFAEQANRWTQTIQQYQEEVAHFQQMLNTFENLPSLLTSIQGNTLKPMSATDEANLVQQNCPGASGTGLVQQVLSATGLTAPSFGQNIAANQQLICTQITQLQVEQYNDSVSQLSQLDTFKAQMQNIENMRLAISPSDPNSIGKLQGVLEQATRTRNTMEASMQTFDKNAVAKKTAIETLKNQQSMLASVALRGKPTVAGQLVQAAAFATAFSN